MRNVDLNKDSVQTKPRDVRKRRFTRWTAAKGIFAPANSRKATKAGGRGQLSLRIASVVAATVLFVGAGTVSASAGPGDSSHAEGQFLSGSLVELNLALAASLAGETATSDGTADQTNANNLDLTALGVVNIVVPGGIQIPLDLANAGVVSQYASALADASAIGASGLVSDSGAIGTGITPAPGVAPGPLSLSLSQVVSSLGLSSGLLAEVANLDLTVGAVSGRASQAAPAAATGAYDIASAQLSFTSPTLGAVVTNINTGVAALQTNVNGLSASLNADLGTLLGPLGTVTTNLTASTPDLAAAVAGLTAGPLTDPGYPGVSIDLSTGAVTVDLDQITGLNGLPPNTEILTPAVINAITANVLGLVTGLTTNVETALLAAVNGITVTGDATILGSQILTVNTTAAALLAGSTTGIVLLGTGLPSDLAVVGALAAPLTTLTTAVNALNDTVLAPVVAKVVPALAPVLNAALTLTVNNQSTAAGVFTETALRVTVLPGANALTLDLGTGRVGAAALGVPSVATSLTPGNGPETGGTNVTVTGTGFTGATDLTIDGVSVPYVIVNDTTITFTTPVHATGAVSVIVVDPAGNSGPLGYTFTPVTKVSAITPTTGPEAGGTTVTITGSCFTGATSVLFGTTPAASFTVVSDTQVTAVAPAGTGTVDVTVTGGGTCGTGTLPAAYTFVAAASVATSLTPGNGPETGGTTVVITGSGFTGATDVTFDGISAATFTVDSDTQITVTTPVHAPALVNVIVVDPAGNSGPLSYTFTPVTKVSAVTPTTGPEAGGTTVTITGSCFTGATSVLFGTTPAASFTVVNATTITAVAPAGTGTVGITVTGGGTCGTGTLPAAYTFVAAASVATSLTPGNGPETGGTTVVITGSGFTGATDVTFDGISAATFTVDSDTQITVTTPVHAPALVNVIVVDPAGNSGPLSYTFTPVTKVSAVTPNTGPEAGGTTVTITGSCFTGATSVLFGTTPAASFTVVNATTITAVAPAGTGLVDVTVTGGGTCGTGTLPAAYTFLPAAVITGLDPDNGPETGGTTVVITGTGFTGATDVTFDGISAATFTVDSDTQITVTTPVHAPALVDVIVLSANGDSPRADYTFTPVTKVSAITPTTGPEAGGTTVTITGSCFTGATSVLFGTTPAASFTVVNATTITAVAPAGTGTVDVTVTGGGTCGTGTLPAAYTFVAAASVATSLTPDNGPETGGTNVTVTGTGFTGATDLTINGVSIPFAIVNGVSIPFAIVNDTTITFTTPLHATGTVSVIVVDPAGNSAPLNYTFTPVTKVSGVTPTTGPEAGGTTVTITGSCFTGATAVFFGTTPAASFTVVNATTITAVAPAGTGTVDVTVTGGGTCGTGVLSNAFTYLAAASVATTLTPDNGPETGGTNETVTGTGFTGVTDLTINGVSVPYVIINDTTITFTTPVHATGTVSVIVVDPAGNSAPLNYTFTPVTKVIAITPTTGPEAGGTTVTITGSCFTGATAVYFGTKAATSFTVVSDTQIRATSPAGTGTVDGSVVGSGTCGTGVLSGAFTYLAAAAVTPAMLASTGFAGLPAAGFGILALLLLGGALLIAARRRGAIPLLAATSLTANNGPATDGTAVAMTGSGLTGAADLTVAGASNPSAIVGDTTNRLTAVPAAVITGVEPSQVPTIGGRPMPPPESPRKHS